MEEIILFIGLAVLFSLISLISWWKNSPGKSWEAYASSKGFTFDKKDKGFFLKTPQVSGRVGKYPFTLDVETRSSGKSSVNYTRFVFQLPFETDFTMKVTEDNVFLKIARNVGFGEDMKTGQPDFDNRFRTETTDSERAGKVLTDNLCDQLLSVKNLELRLSGESVYLLTRGVLKQPEQLDTFLELGEQICKNIAKDTTAGKQEKLYSVSAVDSSSKTSQNSDSFSSENSKHIEQDFNCPSCSRLISPDLATCPFCGQPISSEQDSWW